MSESNYYKQMLNEAYGKRYANQILKRARLLVAASHTPMTKRNKAQREEVSCFEMNGNLSRRLALAVIAVIRDRYTDRATVNMDEALGSLFARADFRELEEEYLIQFFAVAHPYQLVFLH